MALKLGTLFDSELTKKKSINTKIVYPKRRAEKMVQMINNNNKKEKIIDHNMFEGVTELLNLSTTNMTRSDNLFSGNIKNLLSFDGSLLSFSGETDLLNNLEVNSNILIYNIFIV